MSSSYRLGDYLLAMEGLAILRSWGIDPMAVDARAQEMAGIYAGLTDEPYRSRTVVPEYDVAEGYRAWASTYDSMQNVLIEIEETVVRPLLASVPIGRALDAACGTGRHARWLIEQGHEVVGIDATEEMLTVARGKAPTAQFRTGQLDALGLPDASIDLVICALSLTHVPTLERAIAELARVLVAGGRLILSDVHPFCTALGLHAFFRTASESRGCIRNIHHSLSDYLAAFAAAQLEVVRCIEVPWSDQAIAAQPAYQYIPAALDTALRGLPILLVWELSSSLPRMPTMRTLTVSPGF